jgi:hypothetical protein
MNVAPKTTPISQLKPKPVKKAVTYYCTRGQYTFHIPVYERDEIGEILIKDGKRVQVITMDADGNNRVRVSESVKFDRFPVIDPKTKKTDATMNIGRMIVEPSNPRYEELIEAIEKGRKNLYNAILTEDEYKNFVNPIAFQHEQEKEVLIAKNETIEAENARLKALLEEKGIKA